MSQLHDIASKGLLRISLIRIYWKKTLLIFLTINFDTRLFLDAPGLLTHSVGFARSKSWKGARCTAARCELRFRADGIARVARCTHCVGGAETVTRKFCLCMCVCTLHSGGAPCNGATEIRARAYRLILRTARDWTANGGVGDRPDRLPPCTCYAKVAKLFHLPAKW